MQEEVTRGAVTLIVDGAKLSEQVFEKAVKKFLEEIQKSQKPKIYRGRQSLKQLASQNAGLANIEISDKNIKAFSRVAKKYHVDFALKKDTAAEQPRYLVFFKSRDADAITAAFQEFASRKMSREEKPSIRERLTQAKEQAAEKTEHRTIDREKVRKVFSDYSLGMKQRLGIAAAIMHEPELLILDEPINGLDPIGIVEIRSFLSELSHNHGITIFISSHVLSEIEQIADIIGVMHEGHLVEEVNISELHKRNRKYIQFDLSDSEIAGKILENHYHMTDFTVQDGTVRIYDFSQSVGEINREFARNGLLVTRINDSEENLEDYFSKLIGGGGIA